MTSRIPPPARVRAALVAWWSAWVVSAAALAVNQLWFRGIGVGPGWQLGIAALVVQAVMLVRIGQCDAVARMVSAGFLVLAVSTLPIVIRMVSEHSVWSAGYLAAGLTLKTIGVFLLFTGASSDWFAERR